MVTPTYEGRAGHYWDKSTCITTSRGQYLLDDDYDCEFGEPAVLAGTGTTATPIMKRTVRSYRGTAGASGVMGVFIEWRRDITALTAEDYAMFGTQDKRRDITIVHRGPVTIKNISLNAIEPMKTVIPADGGCQIMATTGQRSLGKSMNYIPAGQIGLVFVDPDYEKPTL